MRCSCYIAAVWLGVVFTGSAVHAGRLVSPAEGQVLDRLPIEFEWETPDSAYPVALLLYHEQQEEPRIISVARPDHRCRVDGLVSGKYRWNVLDHSDNLIGEKYGSFELRLPAPPAAGKPETSSVPATVSELLKPDASPATPNVQPPSKPAPKPSKPAPGPVAPAKHKWPRGTILAMTLLVLCGLSLIVIGVVRWIDSRRHDYGEYDACARGFMPGVRNTPVIRIQQLEGKAGHLENTVTPLETKVTHIEEELSRLQESFASETDKLRESLKGYVPTKKLEEILSAAEPEVNRGLHKIEEQGQDIRILQELLSAMKGSLDFLVKERNAAKEALVLTACKQVNAWVEQLYGGVPRETTMLLKALTRASRAEPLPQLMDAGRQFLSEIYASAGGAALCNRTRAVETLQDIRDKLGLLSGGNNTGIQQTVDRLRQEAERIFCSCADGQSQERLDPELAERTRRMLIKELGMPYISIVMGRYAGDAAAASALISDVLGDLGLDLIKIVVGQTHLEKKFHDVRGEIPATDKCPSGTIANVVKMGYVDQRTQAIVRAVVAVAQ